MLKDIVEKFSALNIYQRRSVNDGYCELVFFSKDAEEWNKTLVEIFGQAVKPAGTKPVKSDLLLTKEYGGVQKDQTFFRKDLEGTTIIAMFWPWQDLEHTTLKIAILKK
ncbi:MAG: hypothetical protein ABID09_05060 [Candidatus Omnitrophota bacterium]